MYLLFIFGKMSIQVLCPFLNWIGFSFFFFGVLNIPFDWATNFLSNTCVHTFLMFPVIHYFQKQTKKSVCVLDIPTVGKSVFEHATVFLYFVHDIPSKWWSPSTISPPTIMKFSWTLLSTTCVKTFLVSCRHLRRVSWLLSTAVLQHTG